MSTPFFDFEIPDYQDSIIKVIGVGGGGGNATNHMFRMGIREVDFVVCNTDAQALRTSPVPVKIQLGETLTEGRGAGNKPEVGKNAAIESESQITSILSRNTKMVFITAGMGGGTGTGAAPVIARIARSLGILTVGVVTLPFKFEGNSRIQQAVLGVEEMERHVDSLLVINNERLKKIHGDLFLGEAFAKADEVLATAVKGIAEIITVPGHVNVDFADVQTVMSNSGVALMGSAMAAGDNRAIHAVKMALTSPLLNSNNIRGASNILLNVTSGTEEFRLDELGEITDHMQKMVGSEAQIIWGNGTDLSLDDRIRIIVIATGFRKRDIHEAFVDRAEEDQSPVEIVYPEEYKPKSAVISDTRPATLRSLLMPVENIEDVPGETLLSVENTTTLIPDLEASTQAQVPPEPAMLITEAELPFAEELTLKEAEPVAVQFESGQPKSGPQSSVSITFSMDRNGQLGLFPPADPKTMEPSPLESAQKKRGKARAKAMEEEAEKPGLSTRISKKIQKMVDTGRQISLKFLD
jgi:cell division protein FtsZ